MNQPPAPGIPPTPPSSRPPLPGQPFDPNGGNSGGKLPGWVFGAAIAVGFIVLLAGMTVVSRRNQPIPIGPFPAATLAPTAAEPSPPPPTLAPQPATLPVAATPRAMASIKVHVAGHVNWPGVYSLPANARVQDAINQAGGALPDANLDGLNLAAPVRDGSKITVPAKGEPVTPGPSEAAPPDPVAPAPAETTIGPININTASQAEIETLPGVGPKLAAKIIEVRQQNGGFQSVEDVGNVPGIGPKRLEQMRPYLTVN